ncbi:hypothetical protein Ddc_13879 [Ditylenchus destructor]|nr:hypothetical protein Ddc_13879 [Ditylenchus destructor]
MQIKVVLILTVFNLCTKLTAFNIQSEQNEHPLTCIKRLKYNIDTECEIRYESWDYSGCNGTLKNAVCIYNLVDFMCGREVAAWFIRTRYRPTAPPDYCYVKQCLELMEFMESNGGHLFKGFGNETVLESYCGDDDFMASLTVTPITAIIFRISVTVNAFVFLYRHMH